MDVMLASLCPEIGACIFDKNGYLIIIAEIETSTFEKSRSLIIIWQYF